MFPWLITRAASYAAWEDERLGPPLKLWLKAEWGPPLKNCFQFQTMDPPIGRQEKCQQTNVVHGELEISPSVPIGSNVRVFVSFIHYCLSGIAV